MTRWICAAVSGLVVACLPSARTAPAAPEPEGYAEAPAAAGPAGETPPAPVPAPRPAFRVETDPGDSASLARLAADSARDAAILERLHEVEPPDSPGVVELDLSSAFDINVARYAEHARVKYYLDFFQGPARERMAVWLERLPHYEPMIRAALAANDLPGDLVYLGLIESGYSNTAVSRSRAVGMWQFIRSTGREYGLRIDRWVDERRDPIKATHAAARYLADLTDRLGSHYLAAAAYNGGPGRVLRGLRRIGDAPALEEEDDGDDPAEAVPDDQFFRLSDTRYLRRETKDYVPKLIAAAMIAKQPEKYGFGPIPEAEPYSVDSVPVTEPISLETVARAAGASLEEIVGLNPHYVRRVTPPAPLAWVRVPPGRGVAATEAIAALAPEERVPMISHVVRRGETLASIARRYGMSARDLSELNGGVASKGLKAGATLRVPSKGRLAAFFTADADDDGVRRSSTGWHLVRRGETLGAIARAYRVSVAQLRAWNGLGQSSLIRAGQRIRVRPRAAASATGSTAPRVARVPTGSAQAGGTHLVRRGETLTDISRRYGVTIQALMELNGLRSPRSLQAGARIRLGTD
jgi:membrane-bound lytic murein transglycosylase D